MSAQKFLEKYGFAKQPIADHARDWINQKRVDDFLSTEVTAGVILADLIQGDGVRDTIPSDIKESFQLVVDSNANTYEEVRQGLIERLNRGDEATRGLMSSLQGRVGEFEFRSASNGLAEFSQNPSQEGWDLYTTASGDPQYVQVKVYSSASAALEKVREVEAKVNAGEIAGFGESQPVAAIDFAVNTEIYEELKARAAEEGLSTKILDLGASREEIRERLTNTFHELDTPLDRFFDEFVGGALSAGAVHALVNGYLTYRKAKQWNQAVEDTVFGTAISAGGIAACLVTEAALLEAFGAIAAGPMSAIFVFGVGMGSRAFLRRVGDRRFYVRRLEAGNIRLIELTTRLIG